ncbi:phage head spike fiber domain-containing protein [Vreelandella alkaliphila]|uniref:phage head spike fiber domain-containing protein n=1 Tax=Vreelandella alkaliphila TaxID=272774 RepID=UPI003F9630E7
MVDQVSFPPSIGGSGKIYTNDANPETGMYGGAHRKNFFPIQADMVAAAGYVSQYAQAIDGAKANADRAEDAKGYVEAVADAYKVDLLDQFKRKSTVGLDFAASRFWRDGGIRFETTIPSEILSISRASTKWVKGPDEELREMSNDTLARNWDAGDALGALIERSGTNYALHSNDLSNPAWVKSGSTTVTQEGDHWIVEGATSTSISSGGDVLRSQSVAIPSSQTCSSVELKAAGSISNVTLRWRHMPSGEDYYHVAELKNFWQTFELPAEGSSGDSWRLYVGGPEKFLARNFQFEGSLKSTSRIKTTDSPVSRSEDNLVCNLGDELGGSRGTVFFEHGGIKQSGEAMFFAIGAGPASYLSFGYNPASIGFFVPFAGILGNGAGRKDRQQRWAASYEVLSPNEVKLIICVNGVVQIDETYQGDVSLISGWDKISIGSRFSSFRADSVSGVQFYYSPTASSAAELEELTAL